MPNTPIAWCNSKLRRVQNSLGNSLYASEPVAKDELLVIWGGVIVTTQELKTLPEFARHRAIQVEIDHHLCSGLIDDDADCVNHSCDPNAGLRGQIALVAMKDIAAEEEICFDYAMSDANPDFHMPCACGKSNCRGAVNGDDWKIADLQARYQGYFSPYIAKLIEEVNRVPAIVTAATADAVIYANGHSNGHSNGYSNGYTHTNGSNGNGNGNGNGNSNSSKKSRNGSGHAQSNGNSNGNGFANGHAAGQKGR